MKGTMPIKVTAKLVDGRINSADGNISRACIG